MRKEANYKEMEEMEDECELEPRTINELCDVERELADRFWYLEHAENLKLMETGEMEPYTPKTLARVLKSAKKLERKYGKANLGLCCDFCSGMLHGKLSAIRWVLGMGWDEFMT